MDGFAETMIARGPTFGDDRETVTGSLHVLGLPNVESTRGFVERDPNNCAGVYGEHSMWRFENLLGRTMWEFPGAADEPRFLVVARGHGRPSPTTRLSAPLRERLVLYGALSTLDDARPLGVALAVQAPDGAALETLLAEQSGLTGFPDVEIHAWEFGGRR